MNKKNIIIAITGATGAIYGLKSLEILKEIKEVETHLILSKAAKLSMHYENIAPINTIESLANFCYKVNDIAAPIASGSFITAGMIIAPCSIKTMSEIAYGITENLISRSADVCLKEKRKLVLLVREAPLHSGHLETMLKLSNLGACIYPPTPLFYTKPKSIDDLVTQTSLRAVEAMGITEVSSSIKRWNGLKS